uniref:Uncharacterized protein n=1 Tax=Anguilla anguilla TaxID=7936 RepID=A0A0E9V194_ANGAN
MRPGSKRHVLCKCNYILVWRGTWVHLHTATRKAAVCTSLPKPHYGKAFPERQGTKNHPEKLHTKYIKTFAQMLMYL